MQDWLRFCSADQVEADLEKAWHRPPTSTPTSASARRSRSFPPPGAHAVSARGARGAPHRHGGGVVRQVSHEHGHAARPTPCHRGSEGGSRHGARRCWQGLRALEATELRFDPSSRLGWSVWPGWGGRGRDAQPRAVCIAPLALREPCRLPALARRRARRLAAALALLDRCIAQHLHHRCEHRPRCCRDCTTRSHTATPSVLEAEAPRLYRSPISAIGHQLTSEADAGMYSRLLLCGCRSLEVDIVDGMDDPVVTIHPNTLPTPFPPLLAHTRLALGR